MFDGEKEKHNSFGLASFSRVSSTGTPLFGSEFKHQHFMTLTISRAERQRELSRDWYCEREELVHIGLSESQFVELITTPNMGNGVPCTIYRVAGARMEDTPIRESMKHRYTTEMKETASKISTGLDEATADLIAAIDSGKIGKVALREIVEKLQTAARELKSNLPFVAKQFNEAMEETISHAKTEIEASVSAMAMRIGVDHLRLQTIREAPQLTEATEDDAA